MDECHRGSASQESNWREILEYFEPAFQLGMTATPRRDDNVDTYDYFGTAIYTYSLAQGISDGFLAPYRVHRVVTDYDATGWRPDQGQLDRYGREVPDAEYTTRDFERLVALRARTEAIARHLVGFMKATDRFAKTIVFCVDQEHASEMRRALNNLNQDLVKEHPDYPGDVDGEGDPVALAIQRTVTFANRKVLLVSTPTVKGFSRIESAYAKSDRRRYWVPCPACGQEQVLEWAQVRWPEGERDKAHYVCLHCAAIIPEHRKGWMLERGRWITITRPITESTVVEVDAENPRDAEHKAFEKLWNTRDALWEVDEGSWNMGDPSATAITPLSE